MAIAKSPSRIRLFFGGLWPRVPIIHRYLSRELLIVCGLAVTALTSMTALCGLIKPLRQHGVSATELLEILILLFPVFLVFTLPFALMLACCWVYGRLSADNELSACSSSGINIQTLLIVPLVLGLLGMVLNGVLVNWLVPNWALTRFEGLLARHGKDIVYRELRRRGSFSLSQQQVGRRCVIHADKVYRDEDVLTGIAVAVFAKHSQEVEQIITADSAAIRFLPDGIAVLPQEATVIELPDYNVYKAASLVFSGKIREKLRQRFGSMSLGNLLAMGRTPELYNPIRDSAQEARRILIASEMVKRMHAELEQRGYFELYGQRRYRVKGQAAQATFSEEGARNFLKNATIEEYDPTGEQINRTFMEVKQLDLELVALPLEDGGEELTASMVLRNARIERKTAGPVDVLEQSRFSIRGLGVPADIFERGRSLSLKQIKQGDFVEPFPEKLRGIGGDIISQQEKLSREITLEIHTRLAMAACCPVLAVLGALLGAIFRKGQFLVAVGLSIGPAVVAILFIVMGQRMGDSVIFSTEMAVATVWTGLILLIVANLVLGLKVLRR